MSTTIERKIHFYKKIHSVIDDEKRSSRVNLENINLQIPNRIMFKNIRATGLKLGAGVDVLVGMGIIMTGDFVISIKEGKTIFSYVSPSFGRQIKFEKNTK